jgi:hypothetical protein
MAGSSTVAAKFTVTQYNLRDRNPALRDVDEQIIAQLRSHYRILRGEFDRA